MANNLYSLYPKLIHRNENLQILSSQTFHNEKILVPLNFGLRTFRLASEWRHIGCPCGIHCEVVWRDSKRRDSKNLTGSAVIPITCPSPVSASLMHKIVAVAQIKILHPEWELPGHRHSTKLSLKIFHFRPVVYGGQWMCSYCPLCSSAQHYAQQCQAVLGTVVRVIPKRKPSKNFQKKNDKFVSFFPQHLSALEHLSLDLTHFGTFCSLASQICHQGPKHMITHDCK
jgi:hypothetical protein